jgi:uncharacterized protein (TIGR03435 family)
MRLSILFLLVSTALLVAQAPAFDVASIRPNQDRAGGTIQLQPNGRLMATGTTVKALILRAYALHQSQLIGAPEWIDVERFDIDARVATPPPGGPDGMLPLVRTLLTERFGLRVRPESRELPAFLLIHARNDRSLGSQVRPTQADCSGSAPVSLPDRKSIMEAWPPCGMAYTVTYVDGAGASKSRVRRSGITLKDFAPTLQGAVDRPVLDRTGLEGRYDIEYSFAAQPNTNTTVVALQDVPSIGAALEEQLGLKLESQRTAVPVLVVDSVTRPTEN